MALEAIDRLILRSNDDAPWELLHENSKVSFVEPHPVHKRWPSDAFVVASMNALERVKSYADAPKIALPTTLPSSRQPLDAVILNRESAHAFGSGALSTEQLAKVLWLSYGISRTNEGTPYPRPFRMVPSGGALYPLELYVHATRVDQLEPGLYHYNPEEHVLDQLRLGDESEQIARHLVQGDLARSAAAIVFITAIFARSTFKYGDRGYRFVLIEAGHLSQNANLVAQEMGLATLNVGGYADRAVDRYLGADGLNEGTVYLLLLGRSSAESHP